MKTKGKIVSLILVLLLLFTSACGSLPTERTASDLPAEETSVAQELQILKSDVQLTQEQVLSKIKAEYLIENNGYRDDDEISVMIALSGDALIDTFNDGVTGAGNVAEYALSAQGKAQKEDILRKQDKLINVLEEHNLISDVRYRYSTLINAFSATIRYKNLSVLEGLAEIDAVILPETYNRADDASAITNDVSIYPTGIYDSGSVVYTGKGTAVAVLDSGFDCSHAVFQRQPEGELLYTQRSISEILPRTTAYQLSGGLDLFQVYYSNKIPFAYDYADKDSDVFPYDSEHGTHVSGIIGGYSEADDFTGIAIDTQLVLMKVFPDLNDGAQTDDIVMALEDAVLLNVDAINMSLGSACGFSREYDNDKINAIYAKINASGISLITAASNSYSSGYGGENGNTNKVTNPDSGTVGSPSTYAAALSVASISGVKSKYIVCNGSQVVFFNESRSVSGKENDFFAELYAALLENGKVASVNDTVTLEYVAVPGTGSRNSYSTIDVKGKIALIRRGDNTFEEKAQLAKNNGAVACIIYNNVEGDILMSMGKTDHVPTISISKSDGVALAEAGRGTMKFSYTQQAGPFMSDFSSWGPTPSLEIKPEITAHGGEITSAIPGGGYDALSGTSMASPNLAGIVLLIRQYIKDNYAGLTDNQIKNLTNQLLMSSATIILNEQGNPYSPRKQGAGLADLEKAVTTKAYITVDGKDRPKIELGDDKKREGVYTMQFNLVNLTAETLLYDLSVIGMTESVSTSDSKYVAEKPTLLNGAVRAELVGGAGTLNGNKVTLNGNGTVTLKVTYTLQQAEKDSLDNLFPYGMYVEGFVKLTASYEKGVDLNVPFLAFYGDWTEAPIFDKTYYEVQAEANDASIDDEDKLKADYYATTPYGSYYYNYIIPLGTYLYDIDTTSYDKISADEDHIVISDYLGAVDGIFSVYAGLLRNARTMTYTITDKISGETVYENVDYNARKAFSYGGTPVPYYNFLRLKSDDIGLINNRRYEFKMTALLDYGDGGATTNIRNTFSFDFYLDDEAPVIKSATYEKVYDKTLQKDRYYVDLVVYDNQYTMSVSPLIFTSASTYTALTDLPIPVYSDRNSDTTVRIEITDFLEDACMDELVTGALAFSVDDYALNSNIFVCQLPGTRGEFSFTKEGTSDSDALQILSVYTGEVVDLTKYLVTSDKTADADKDYLKYLSWTSSGEKIATVQEGKVKALAAGRTTVTVTESINNKKAALIINVKDKTTKTSQNVVVEDYRDAAIENLRFSYFDTLFAYSRAAQTSEIGSTGSRNFLSSMNGVSLYPGERIQLFYDLDPWYAASNYEGKLTYSSANPEIVSVDEDGVVTALKKGTAYVDLTVEGSQIRARLRFTVKSEFVIEERTLIAYKGLGGAVEIPDDEGILYIGAYAFCLYDTDYSVELTEDDYDANKIPSANTTVTSVTIPEGVEEIRKYAFYNCTGLKQVTIPKSAKYVREYAFYGTALTSVDLGDVYTVGARAFYHCDDLVSVSMKAYGIGAFAFADCVSLTSVDLTTLRNSGDMIFNGCTSLAAVTMTENTKLSQGIFSGTALREVTVYERRTLPRACFSGCKQLTKVTFKNDLNSLGYGAFYDCTALTDVVFEGTLEEIGEYAFNGCRALTTFTLPDCQVTFGNCAFYHCTSLEKVVLRENTVIGSIEGSTFEDTALTAFEVAANNDVYSVNADGTLLLNKAGDTVVFAAVAAEFGDLVLDESIHEIGEGAFCGADVTTLTLTYEKTVVGPYAFALCKNLTKVTIPANSQVVFCEHAFNASSKLEEVENMEYAARIDGYAFARTGIKTVIIGDGLQVGEGAFFGAAATSATIGKNVLLGVGAFEHCGSLKTVIFDAEGGITLSEDCFAYDSSLTDIDLGAFEIIPDELCFQCTSLKAVDLTSAKKIGVYAFADCGNLSSVTLSVAEEIADGAFGRYATAFSAPSFLTLILPETLKIIGDGAFIYCNGLTEIEIPESVETLGDYVFAFCSSLEKVTLHDNVRRIGTYAFAGCTSLTDIDLSNVEEIDDFAFSKTTNGAYMSLAQADLSNLKKIGESALCGTGITEVTAPKLTNIADHAFRDALLQTVYAPAAEYIGDFAFAENENLTEACFSEALKEIGIGAFWKCPALETVHFAGEGGKVTNGAGTHAKLVQGVLYMKMPSGNWKLSVVPGNYTLAGQKVTQLTVEEGTYRIEASAGGENKNITEIILPDSLKQIGNYAFYGYDALKKVEFRSFTAPMLESYYVSGAELQENDVGYDLLHSQVNLYGFELYYFNFIDLVGKNKPIEMVLPKNGDIEGYDALVYEAYFGKMSAASRSDYTAMDKYLMAFIGYAEEISRLSAVTLSEEKLINNAVTAYNSTEQNATDYGYSQEAWQNMVQTVSDARQALFLLKLANAGKAVQDLQAELDDLPTAFSIDMLSTLADLAARINALSGENRSYLDLSGYNALVASYNAYKEAAVEEVRPLMNAMDGVLSVRVAAAVLAFTSIFALALVVGKSTGM